MNINDDIHRILADGGRDFLLAVVLSTAGSTPGKVGAKAILYADGGLQGTIGGGRVEAEIQRRVAETLKSGRPVIADFPLDGTSADDEGPICGGQMRILLDPTVVEHQAAFSQAAASRENRQRGVLLTTILRGKDTQVQVEFLSEQAVSLHHGFPGHEAILAALKGDRPVWHGEHSTSPHDTSEVLIEPVVPAPQVLIVGGGHVGQAVATQAALVGFHIIVLDDRPDFACPGRFPEGTRTYCGDVVEQLSAFPFDADTYVVIATRGHRHDAEALATCIHQPAAYIGMIGSRRKVAMLRKQFIDAGRATADQFDRVYAPIGLDVGAITVPEIAASIVAQLIAVRRTGGSPRIPLR